MSNINKAMHTNVSFLGIFDNFLRVITLWKKGESYAKDSDWLSLSKAARIEPICVVSKSLVTKTYYNDILQTNLNIIASLYMSAVPMVSVIGKVKVAKILGQLNPDRDLDTFIAMESDCGNTLGNYDVCLPTRSMAKRLALQGVSPSKNMIPLIPAHLYPSDPSMEGVKDALDGITDAEGQVSTSTTVKDKEVKSHVVGKELEVTLQADGEKMDVHVSVQLSAVPVDDELITAVVTNETLDANFTERYHKWNAGAISFGEFLLAGDLLKKRKKMLMKDGTGFYEEALRRSRNGKIWGILLQAPSLAEASNIYIIDQHAEKAIEKKFRGKMKDKKVRKQIFSNTKALVFCVVDTDYEIMRFYYRNIEPISTVRIKDIQKKSKGDDLLELVAVLNKGTAPVF